MNILVNSQSRLNKFSETNQHNSALLSLSLFFPMKVWYKPQTWNAALLKILSSRLVRITLFPLHSLVPNQEPYRSCPSYRVPRSRVTRFSALQRFQRNFLGKIGFNKGDGVATQTLFMLAIIFCYHWYETVLNTCSNGTKRRKNAEFGRLQAFTVSGISFVSFTSQRTQIPFYHAAPAEVETNQLSRDTVFTSAITCARRMRKRKFEWSASLVD